MSDEQEFCCEGCRFVHHLLHKRGLEEFYNFGETMVPAGSFVFHERDYRWIGELQRTAEANGEEMTEVMVDVQGISCAGCVWLIEAVFMEHPGAISCLVNSSSGTVRLRWNTGMSDLAAYARDLQRFGYLLGPLQGKTSASLGALTRKLGLCGFLAMNAMLFASPRYFSMDPGDALVALFDIISFGLATASIALGGTYFFRRAWAALRMGALHIDLPISLGLLFAYAGSVGAWLKDQHSLNYFDFVSIFTFLMLLGRWLQERAVEANRRRLLGLRLSPGRVRMVRGDATEEVEAREISGGEEFIVARNQVVPVRSRLRHRGATFALNWITGEPAPRSFSAGGIVPAGARSLDDGDLTFEALEGWEESQLSALLRIDAEREWRNRGLERLIRIYLGVVLTLAATGFFAWGFGAGSWLSAFQVMISVLVVSCPCAIGVALPLLDDIAAARLQQYGVYLRAGSVWARLRHVTTLLFDKTGTITLETLRPANPGVFGELSVQTKSYLLRMVERSLHPVAACLREALLSSGIEPAQGDGAVREIPGMGLEWESPVGCWRLGRCSWVMEGDDSGGTVLALDGTEVARFRFREELRPDAAAQVAQFQAAGMDVYLLSGDEQARVEKMGGTLALPEGHALGGLTPDDKADLVRRRWAGNALMLGDGANDSLAFDAALCRGTPAVDAGLLEHKADFYLLGRGLNGLGTLFGAGRSHRRTTLRVFAFAMTYNALAVSASLAGWMSPLVAAVIMPLSSLVSIGIVLAGFRVPASGYFPNTKRL
ncbi:MAG: heavy metal translocating P-type ATPase metal-binding domain-containing protein [Chthoniobacterales bacterium]|nr:heavy metal translocating P-type ATPase metal-binding domain-containing protein [Chthoniobacterales bacterium]